jgi:hypothetical protein
MRAWPLHVAFAAILFGSLGAKYRTTDLLVESNSFEPAVMRVAREHGLIFRDYTTINGSDIRALEFKAPGCARPMLVVLLSVTFDQERVARSVREPGYVLRYVYIDRSWEKADRLAVVAERAKYAILAIFGLTQYLPSWHLLLVESPEPCQVPNDIDWRIAWSRDYLVATGANSGNTR